MKHLIHIIFVFSAAFLLSACFNQEHFITDREYLAQVEDDFTARMKYLPGSEAVDGVFSSLDKAEGLGEREALMFLYAYMPLGDLADYDGRLWREGVKSAFAARQEMPWGMSVPENLFRHFVLPLRVNNENLDSCRTVFYGELKDRVCGLTMTEAALEVNHWCHEKVTYSPSDIRTSAPLATVKTSWGRCGEESVLCVAALRSVGIPARQVYTPRWAHTDDNHAWVEVWTDGKWHYLGACEPEPRLDMAWFSSTVKRGVLMHTKAFGRYTDESAEVISTTPCYTELNVTENYVPVSRVEVQVVDETGAPVADAKVEFKIYNYAEFYPAITSYTDEDGSAGATFGRGDILVWASRDGRFGYSKVTPGTASAVTEEKGFFGRLMDRIRHTPVYSDIVVLNHMEGDQFSDSLDIVPPPAAEVSSEVRKSEADSNSVRLAAEDSIRNAYVGSFPPGDKYTVGAFGNWEEIESFIFLNSSTPQRKMCAERMLDLMNEKDMRDTPCDILMDHIIGFHEYCGYEGPVSDYVLNPRVANEMLTPYVGQLHARYGDSLNVEDIRAVAASVNVMDEQNPARIPVSPYGVARTGAADARSRDIFFVSMCRAYGIPSRLDPVDSDPQYWEKGRWRDVEFGISTDGVQISKGKLNLDFERFGALDDPKYEIHFTLSKLEGGSPVLLNFTDSEGREGSASWKSVFRGGVSLESGSYLLTAGIRMASGKVLSTIRLFDVREDSVSRVSLNLRKSADELQVIGSMNVEDKITVLNKDADSVSVSDQSVLSVTGRGYFVLCFVESGNEPCNHSIQSLLSEAPRFPSIIVFQSSREFEKMNWNTFPAIPENVTMAVGGELFDSICTELKMTSPPMPVTVIADSFGRIVYVSTGYSIGLSEQLKKL